MCTVVVLRRPGHPWPLVFATNRDEMRDRPWRPPGRHWPDHPGVVAGLDEEAGGSWLGVNDARVIASVLNRVGSLGSEAGKRSRGELVPQALDHGDAGAAASWISRRDPAQYRAFNMVVADNLNAYWLRHRGDDSGGGGAGGGIEIFELPPGLSMITARGRNDPASARVQTNLHRFEVADAPDPRTGKWGAWKRLMASRRHAAADGAEAAMAVVTNTGFETLSSSLLALPGPPHSLRENPAEPVWLFAPGRPGRTRYEPVAF